MTPRFKHGVNILIRIPILASRMLFTHTYLYSESYCYDQRATFVSFGRRRVAHFFFKSRDDIIATKKQKLSNGLGIDTRFQLTCGHALEFEFQLACAFGDFFFLIFNKMKMNLVQWKDCNTLCVSNDSNVDKSNNKYRYLMMYTLALRVYIKLTYFLNRHFLRISV